MSDRVPSLTYESSIWTGAHSAPRSQPRPDRLTSPRIRQRRTSTPEPRVICQRVPPNIKSLGHHAGIVGRAGGAYREAGATDTQSKQTVIGMRNDVCFGDLIKVLCWDGQGLCRFAKRLEKGRFIWPQAKDGAVCLTPAQLSMMLEGIDWVRRETGKRQEVKVHHGEGVAIHIDPESCASGREAAREALTGARAGQPLSGERLHNRSADVIQSAEGNMIGRAIASTRSAPRHRRPWHARTSFAREPRGLRTATGCRSRGRIGKARCRSR